MLTRSRFEVGSSVCVFPPIDKTMNGIGVGGGLVLLGSGGFFCFLFDTISKETNFLFATQKKSGKARSLCEKVVFPHLKCASFFLPVARR